MTLMLGGREVARIGLGTNRLRATPKNVAFVREAVAAGVSHIDTAHTYAGGGSEETIGEALSSAGGDPLVATKGGYGGAGRGRPDVLRAEIEESLRRLRVELIDLYYLHRVDPETPLEDSLATIAAYREEGRIRDVGISDVGIEEIERAREAVPIAAVQNRYNLSDRRHEDEIDYCAENGIAFVAYYPLHGDAPPALEEIAARHDATATQVRLAWLLHRSPTTVAIPGTLSIDHLRENLAAPELELSDAEFEAL